MSEGGYIKGDIGEYREMCEKIAHGTLHNALDDARWTRDAWEYITRRKGAK